MVDTEAGNFEHQGKVVQPHLLLVDDSPIHLNSFVSHQGMMPCSSVSMQYGATPRYKGAKVHPDVITKNAAGQPNSIADIVVYAMDPANKVDGVLTDLNVDHPGGEQFGVKLIEALKQAGFKGPMAVHSTVPTHYLGVQVEKAGGIGIFAKSEALDFNDPKESGVQMLVKAINEQRSAQR